MLSLEALQNDRMSGSVLLLTDKFDAPANFLLVDLLSKGLKGGTRCTFVSTSDNFKHWKAIVAKMVPSLDLSHYIQSHSFTFIEGLDKLAPNGIVNVDEISQESILQNIYAEIKLNIVTGRSKDINLSHPLVIIENISLLEWLGTPLPAIIRFVRAVRMLCIKESGTLVIHQSWSSENIDDLFRLLLQFCTLHIEVLPLASGRSSTVSGEIAIHQGPTCPEDVDESILIPRDKARQYHVSDTTVVYFDKGTSSGVL